MARRLTAAQAGALPVEQMPGIARGDYVGNFNDSYWLTNANAPMTGYPRIAGATGTPQSLRTRFGHLLAAQLQREEGGITRDALKSAVLRSGSMSERLFRKPLLDAACNFGDPTEQPARSLRRAARLGRHREHRRARRQPVGRILGAPVRIAPERLYANAFDPAAPLATPGGFNTSNPSVVQDLKQALGGAVLALKLNGFALNSRRGDILYTMRNGARVPLYGGCDEVGYFTIVCARRPLDSRGYSMDLNGHGNAICRWCRSARQGVDADTMLHTPNPTIRPPRIPATRRGFSPRRRGRAFLSPTRRSMPTRRLFARPSPARACRRRCCARSGRATHPGEGAVMSVETRL